MDWLEKSRLRHEALVASYKDKRLESAQWSALNGQTIVSERFGNPLVPNCGSYGAHTFVCEDGSEYVLWSSLGEVNLSKVVDLYKRGKNWPHGK